MPSRKPRRQPEKLLHQGAAESLTWNDLPEADLIMAVDGYPALADLTRDSLRRVTTWA